MEFKHYVVLLRLNLFYSIDTWEQSTKGIFTSVQQKKNKYLVFEINSKYSLWDPIYACYKFMHFPGLIIIQGLLTKVLYK